MTTVAEIVSSLNDRFNPEAATGLDIIFQFDISDGDTYHLLVKDNSCEVKDGAHDDPSVTLMMDSDTMVGIMTGEVNGMSAFMMGKIRAEGNMMLATKLTELFPAE